MPGRQSHPRAENLFFEKAVQDILDKDINEFKVQKEEVAKIKWFSREELIKELNDNPENFLKTIKDCVEWFK